LPPGFGGATVHAVADFGASSANQSGAANGPSGADRATAIGSGSGVGANGAGGAADATGRADAAGVSGAVNAAGANGTSDAPSVSGTGGADGVSGSAGNIESGTANSNVANGSDSLGGTPGAATDDHITVSVVRLATTQLAGMVSVLVPEATVTSGNGFTFPLPHPAAEAAAAGDTSVTLMNGKRLPGWLQYMPTTQTFVVTAAPAGALPVEVLVRVGTQHWRVLITETH
jgi:hypothetical protein